MGPKFCPTHKPLYQATWGNLDGPLLAPTSLHTAIQTLIKHLPQAPSLYLPDYPKHFILFLHSRQGHALAILCQKGEGGGTGPLVYLSNNSIPSCLDGHLVSKPYCNHPLNTWSPKTNGECSSNVCSPHSFKDLLRLSFLCLLLNYKSSRHTSLTHPFLLCLVNLLIPLAYSLHQIQKQDTYLMAVWTLIPLNI